MSYTFYDKISSSGYDDLGLLNQSLHNFGGSNGVLESGKGKVVKCPVTKRVGKDDISEAKALAALKNHSEAEKRRRERINGHLATLRGLVASNDQKNSLPSCILRTTWQ
ncbi:hypothetical protein TSUD_96300 [Trifolium subterraneum]|nr:hypothetical protein TSUD_96300 [Trifolium subterraneum]